MTVNQLRNLSSADIQALMSATGEFPEAFTPDLGSAADDVP